MLRRERREQIKAQERIAHSERQGRKDRDNRRYIGPVVNDRRNSAEKAQGARRSGAQAKVEAARAAVSAAEGAVRDDDSVRIDLVDPQVPRGRRMVELVGPRGGAFVLQGPERVALIGPNGAGKTTLLERLKPLVSAVGRLHQPIRLDDEASALELVREAAPAATEGEVLNRLARLLIRGPMARRAVGTLSGGERFRVALAQVLLADPSPELLIMDEPTNDLDLATVDQLVEASSGYAGALVVVSHDLAFLRRLRLDRVLRLDSGGQLTEVSLGALER